MQGRLKITCGRQLLPVLAGAHVLLSHVCLCISQRSVRTASVAAETVSAHAETSDELSGPLKWSALRCAVNHPTVCVTACCVCWLCPPLKLHDSRERTPMARWLLRCRARVRSSCAASVFTGTGCCCRMPPSPDPPRRVDTPAHHWQPFSERPAVSASSPTRAARVPPRQQTRLDPPASPRLRCPSGPKAHQN